MQMVEGLNKNHLKRNPNFSAISGGITGLFSLIMVKYN